MSTFSEIIVRDFDEKDIFLAIEKLQICEDLISEDLVDCVVIYESTSIRNRNNMKERASRRLSGMLNQIDNTDGWKIFIQFFDIRTNDNELPKLAMVMPLLDTPVKPALPWSLPVGCNIFKEKIEDLLLKPGDYDIAFEEFIGEIITFDPAVAETIKRMQMGVHRNKAIIDLLMNLGLMEALNLEPKLRSYNIDGTIKEETVCPKINGDNLKEYVKNIFLKHYLKEKENVERQEIFPKLKEVKMSSWNNLLRATEKLNHSILKVKEKYLNSITTHQFSEKLQVFDAIRNFLKLNKLDEETPLSIPELQSKYKAYGLVKKISKGPGMAIVKKDYLAWLTREKMKENQKLDPYNKKISVEELKESLGVKVHDIETAISFLKIKLPEEDPRLKFEDEYKIRTYLFDKFNPYKIQSAKSKASNRDNASKKALRSHRDKLKLSKENSK